MKVYPPEFKADAVGLFHSDPDLTIAQTARDLGVNAETLRNWIRADRTRGGSTTGLTRKNVTSSTPRRGHPRGPRSEDQGPGGRAEGRTQGERHARHRAGHPGDGLVAGGAG